MKDAVDNRNGWENQGTAIFDMWVYAIASRGTIMLCQLNRKSAKMRDFVVQRNIFPGEQQGNYSDQ